MGTLRLAGLDGEAMYTVDDDILDLLHRAADKYVATEQGSASEFVNLILKGHRLQFISMLERA